MQRQLGSGVSSGLVELDMTFEKIVATLSIIEELNLLSQVQGPEILKYKQTHPSIAFIHEWPDKKLVYVLQKMSSDQIVTYLRLKPDLKERVIGLCPEMTAEVVTDDFNQPDRFSIAEKTIHLEEVSHLLLTMQQDKEFNLEEIFSAKSEPQDTNVVSIKTA